MTHNEKEFEKELFGKVISEFTNIDSNKLVTDLTVVELYQLIKLALNRIKETY